MNRKSKDFMHRQGYNYYVYVGPGHIEYFEDYYEAEKYSEEIGIMVKSIAENKKPTYMKRQGYNYYVYVGPGRIEYFEDINKAQEYAEEVGAIVQEVW